MVKEYSTIFPLSVLINLGSENCTQIYYYLEQCSFFQSKGKMNLCECSRGSTINIEGNVNVGNVKCYVMQILKSSQNNYYSDVPA